MPEDGAWRSATQASHDVKELVPEFFCNPGFLANASGLPLGTTQALKRRLRVSR